MPVQLVQHIEALDWGGETVRIGDLDGDGAPDLLVAQSVYGSRVIESLTALTVAGQRLWQWGRPSAANGQCYSDLPVQVYDWDGDGANEVLFVEQAVYAEPIEYGELRIRERAKRYEGDAWMVVLEAASGREKSRFPIPAPADDSFLFADLTGRGRRQDLVVKDRYWNMWGVAFAGEVLWHWAGSVGHYPAIADVDGDGCDEVFVGCALLDHDGREVFSRDPGGSHQDAAHLAQLPDGEWRLLFGNGGLHCLDLDGREVWRQPLREVQHVVAGRYRPDSPLQVAVIDRGHPRTPEGKPATLHLYDLEDGRQYWQRLQPPGGWVAAALDIRWTGKPDLKEILVYERVAGQPMAIYDGWGEMLDTLEVPPEICGVYHGNPGIHIAYRADVWGDSREEVLVAGWKGLRICTNRRPLAIPTLYNNTLYHGM
ncbi:MAG: hypothetical protein FJY95_05440 [Candidatus Handelsmanbacteria bacterium]|nr:hypothetical protein [Candidatus Handelsmanbacteria bacterium]